MSSTNKTTYYELPQFVDNDIFNPLVDDNDAYSKIDTALHNIADAEAEDASEIVGVKSRLDSAEDDIDALEIQNGDNVLSTTAQTLSGAVNELDADIALLDGRVGVVEDDINNVTTGLKAKVASLNSRVTTNEEDISNLKTTSQTLVNDVDEIEANIDKMSVYVTPEMFGAVGDGVTDDTIAIQQALSSDENVLFSNDYLITSPLRVRKGIKLGANTKITAGAVMDYMFYIQGDGDKIYISGGELDCNSLAEIGISVESNGVYLNNIKITNATDASIHVTQGGHNWIIGCKLFNPDTFATCIRVDSPDVKVVNCELYYTNLGIDISTDIIFISNTQIWSGGSSNVSNETYGIKTTAEDPLVFCSAVYVDSFWHGFHMRGSGYVSLSSCLFFWGTSTTPTNCVGLFFQVNSKCDAYATKFFGAPNITYTEVIMNSVPRRASTQVDSMPQLFAPATNITNSVLTSVCFGHLLVVDFVLRVDGTLTTDSSTTWLEILIAQSMPFEVLGRVDAVIYNTTKQEAIACRLSANNFPTVKILIHPDSDIGLSDLLYGTLYIPIS